MTVHFPTSSSPSMAVNKGTAQDKAIDVAEKFTTVFFTQFVSEMMKEQECEGGFGEEMFQTVLAEQIGKELALSETGESMVNLITAQLVKLQEKKPTPDSLQATKSVEAPVPSELAKDALSSPLPASPLTGDIT